MATKKLIMHVCDRCGLEQDKPLPGQIKVLVTAKKWNNWDLCETCNTGLGDYLLEPSVDDGDGMD